MDSSNRGLDLEKELTCSICTEVLYQPLTLLDCLHTFCGSCLKEWFSWQLAAAQNSSSSTPASSNPYTCPSCRAPVRDTKHNATVTTLLEMYLASNPEKGKTAEEKTELEKKYKPGDNVLPKVDSKKSLRERMVEDEDRTLMNEVRDLSLREAGVESSEARRQRRRREEGRSHEHRQHSSRDNSRENRESRTAEDRERRRRREAEAERRRTRDDAVVQQAPPTEERRRRRSDGESRRRREEVRQSTVRQIEHQSSLRSLISSSDTDSREMEEEILRQIREEGLLDGIDLENIDVNQEDQISERIAEAFRRRQDERARQERARRSDASGTRSRTQSQTRTMTTASTNASRDVSTGTSRRRTHSRSPSGASQSEEHSRPPPSMSAIQASHLEVQSSDEGRRRRRTTSSSRNSTPVAITETRAGTRSQTDLSDRPRSSRTSINGSLASSARSSTDPIVRRSAELPASERTTQEFQPVQPSSSPSAASSTLRPEDKPESTSQNAPKSRAAPPSELPLTPASTSSAEPLDTSLLPLPLSPRGPSQPTLADRANALSSGSRPTSSSSTVARPRPEYFAEPSITCARCGNTHIEYDLHYNCEICSNGNYNVCLSCYRTGKGCLYWFGFSNHAASTKWKNKTFSGELPPNAEQPHMLRASRYVPPKTVAGGAEGRKTLTTEDPQKRLQSGAFCANCLAWANECYWRCDVCNDGDWGFCNLCVNQGRSCTHPLLPLASMPSDQHSPPLSPSHDQKVPPSASIMTGPNVVTFGSFRPLAFSTVCDVCHYPIQPTSSRFHCFACTSRVPNTQPGDYDICSGCYPKLVSSRRISAENGPNGWRRCLRGHRMVVVGFEDDQGSQRRVIVQDLVGGHGLIEEAFVSPDQTGGDLMQWSWGNGVHISGDRSHKKLVTKDVMKSVPASVSGAASEPGFPPSGGVGMKAVAIWGWYPADDADDEILFPKGAEVRECKDVNTDWYYGSYMGKSGLFQANYVRVLDTTVG